MIGGAVCTIPQAFSASHLAPRFRQAEIGSLFPIKLRKRSGCRGAKMLRASLVLTKNPRFAAPTYLVQYPSTDLRASSPALFYRVLQPNRRPIIVATHRQRQVQTCSSLPYTRGQPKSAAQRSQSEMGNMALDRTSRESKAGQDTGQSGCRASSGNL